MANFEVNPITGQLDLVGASASYINGTAATPADLPTTVGNPALDSVYLAKAGSGVWLINRKPAGLYCRVANDGDLDDWQHLGAFPEVNADGNWELYNSATPSKELKFDLSGISTATTRTLTVPNASGTIALLSNFLSATRDMVVLAPDADMSVTSSTTLADISGMSFTVAANTSYLCVCAWQIDCSTGGFQMVLDAPSVYAGGNTLAGYGVTVNGANSVAGVTQAGSTEIRAGNRGAAQVGPTFAIFTWRTDSTGGTAKFRFAQNGSNATASVLKAQSRVLVIPIAS